MQQPLYGVSRPNYQGLPTWHEEPGYEDWIIKREQLASIYYQDPGFEGGRHFQHYAQQGEHTANHYNRWSAGEKITRHELNDQKRPAKVNKVTPKQVDIDIDLNQNESKVSRRSSVKRRVDKKKLNKENKTDEKISEFDLDTLIQDPEPCEELSMWSCRRCTLDNDLQEKVCGACGGSRLCSIGDIDIPRMFRCDKVEEMIEQAEKRNMEINKERENNLLFIENKRLSKIEDDDDDDDTEEEGEMYKLLEWIDSRSLFALVTYVIIFIFMFNY